MMAPAGTTDTAAAIHKDWRCAVNYLRASKPGARRMLRNHMQPQTPRRSSSATGRNA